MSGERLSPRGIVVDDVLVVAIQARIGFVSLCTRRLPQPLGRAAWLHAVRLLVGAGLKVWPDAADDVGAALTRALDDAQPDPRAA